MLMTPAQRDLIVSLARRVHGTDSDAWLTQLRADQPRPSVGDASRIIADLKREADKKPSRTLLPGSYALRDDDGTITLYTVECPATGKWAGYVFVSRIDDQDRTPMRGKEGARVRRAIEADPLAAACLYGTQTTTCGICHRELTNPESRERGIGPVCAAKF